MDRRSFLLSFGAVSAALSRRALAAPSKAKVLVVVVQRGAVDGLSMLPPIADARYYALRPTIAVPRPNAKKGGTIDPAKPLDGFFGLHPSLAPLLPFWSKGALAFVHAVGSPDLTRSHFDAQDHLETGTPGLASTEDGWLSRALVSLPSKSKEPLRALAVQPTLPRILRGDAGAVAFASLADARAFGKKASSSSFEAMYESALDEAMRGAAHDAFAALHALDAKVEKIEPANGATYPTSPLGKRMKQIAQLVRADVGVEVAVTECGGWDTHANQVLPLARRLDDLARALAAFAIDLGDRLADTCVVTATEFGRTVKENGTFGTDHGHGSVMAVLGGGVKGKKVHGTWKGLADDVLHEGRDLPVTTDHRTVFSEVLRGHLGAKDLSKVFPGFTAPKLGLF